jgi:uncharacterized protein YfaS (alpha-2-macroglobulin family)
MVNSLQTQIKPYSAFNDNFGSNVRDEAMILETCILLNDMPQALNMARRISDYLSSGSYSTQTTAWALLAMARFAEKSGKGDLNFTTTYLGKTNKIETQDPVYMEELTQLKKSGKVSITNHGSSNLYLGNTMISAPMEDRSPAVNNNLKMTVEYADFNYKTLNPAQLKQGADFTITVKITNTGGTTHYTNLALTHILPSGWEIFNTRLGNESGGQDFGVGITYQDIRDDRVLSYFDLAPGKSVTVTIRVQAAYLGRFFMPAIACQAMYDNTVYARTQGMWVEVVK